MVERTIFQTGIGLDAETLARCDRLRACLGRSRSYVIEKALHAGGLASLEAEHVNEIRQFNVLAELAGYAGWQQYATAYVEAFGAKTYPPDVDALAAMKFTGRETREQLNRKVTRLAGQRRAAAREEREDPQPVDAPVEKVEPNRPLSLRDLRP
jgi:predicted transcriptional regulator